MWQLTLMALAAFVQPDVARAAGGGVEELRAALDLEAPRVEKLRALFAEAEKDSEGIRKTAREKGADAARDQRDAWQKQLREKVKAVLSDLQKARYDDWLARKDRLAAEFDKALFGIPTVTEMKLKLSISAETAEKMQRAADNGIEKIRKKVIDLKSANAKQEEIAQAVNQLRRETIERMIESTSGTEQKRVKEFIKSWLQTPEAKLSKTERERLGRVMKTLQLKDAELEKKVRSLVAAVLMHHEENTWLRRGLGKELIMAVVKAKKDADIWITLSEYGALVDIHTRRLESLGEDLKNVLSTKQVAKLVAEGILD